MTKESDMQLSYVLISIGVLAVIIAGATYPSELAQFFGSDPTLNIIVIIFGVLLVIGGIYKYLQCKDETTTQQTSRSTPPMQSQAPQTKYCNSCGRSIPAASIKCPYCSK